jgi:quinol monooxygenase YgiN
VITVIAKLTAAEGKAAEMRAALEKMVAAVDTDEPAVQQYSLYEADGQDGIFFFVEQYPDADVLAAHRTTPHMAALGEALRGVSGGRPEITRVNLVRGITR